MPTTIPVPQQWVESVSRLKFPATTDRRIQYLMDRNNDGLLTADEKLEFEALVVLSEELTLVRAVALKLLKTEAA